MYHKLNWYYKGMNSFRAPDIGSECRVSRSTYLAKLEFQLVFIHENQQLKPDVDIFNMKWLKRVANRYGWSHVAIAEGSYQTMPT